MKHIKDMFRECCAGAATPASTLGAGNPCAPSEGGPGSGDTFDHQARTAKSKKERKRKPTNEGLLDDDFDITDTDILHSFLDRIPEFAKMIWEGETPTQDEWQKYLEDMRSIVKGIPKRDNQSMMKSFRSKDCTMIIFKKTIVDPKTRKTVGTDGFEIRKFVKNPLPYSIILYWDTSSKTPRLKISCTRTNHPVILNFRQWDCYVAPADVFDRVVGCVPQARGFAL